MDTVAQFFARRGYSVTDLSLQRLGWDLEARRGRGCLRLEVKGTSPNVADASVDMTPNEYATMKDHEMRDSFRLCVVTDCERTPRLDVFAWSDEQGAWSSGDGSQRLVVDELVGAHVRLTG